MKIGYALLVSNECHNFVRQIQLGISQQTGIGLARQSPHITIKSPFDTDNIKVHIAYLEDLAKRIEPFEIECNGFGAFGKHVIFLDVVANQTLNDLHQQILREVGERFNLSPHEFEGEQVKFHVSVAGFNEEALFESAQNYLKAFTPKFHFKASTFGLFYYLGPGNGWIINRKIDIS